jgi:flagellar assembly protein FliH
MTMNTSRDGFRPAGVLRAVDAAAVPAVRFDVDLGARFRPAVTDDRVLAEARATALAQGYAAGWAEGKRQAADAARAAAEQAAVDAARAVVERTAALDRAVAAVAAAATALERQVAPAVTAAEEAVLRAALTLTETLLGHELAASRSPGEDALRRALALAPAGRPVTVRLHPDDLAALTGCGPADRDVDGRAVTLLADPRLQPGDAVAECDATTVDARLGPALDRVREVLAA